MPCDGPESLSVHRFSVVIFTFSGPLGLLGHNLFEGRAALSPGLGDMRDVACVRISHGQIQKNERAVFNFGWCVSKGSQYQIV